MTTQRSICSYICALACSFSVLLCFGQSAAAQEQDTIPLFRGFSAAVDLVGPAELAISDYGQLEASLHLNLKDRYFPVLEVGYGKADKTDDGTNNSYKTSAPFFRVGVDFNILKNKHDVYRLLLGARYGFTSYKYDVSNPTTADPIWGGDTGFEAKDVKCSYQWIEACLGVDVKIYGPLHLGWSLRYKRRTSYDDSKIGKSWYVPGYGKSDGSGFGALFNVSLDI